MVSVWVEMEDLLGRVASISGLYSLVYRFDLDVKDNRYTVKVPLYGKPWAFICPKSSFDGLIFGRAYS